MHKLNVSGVGGLVLCVLLVQSLLLYQWILLGVGDWRTASISHRGHFPNDLTNQVTRDGHDPVASGGFADIYRGMFQDNGQSIKVAIKAIKTYSGEDDKISKKQKRLWREVKVWLDLKHDNVLPLLGTTMGFGRFPAMSLGGRDPWSSGLNNVASGLQYLHSHSVVHGDLSGSNVLIHGSGRACIADFGLSMLLTDLGTSTFFTSFHAQGTLRWAAPELLDLEVSEDDVDGDSPHVLATTQSDVYSFGSIMLQILSGKVPYHYYKREAQVLHAISKGKTPRRPSSALVTERRWMFIQQCWSAVDTWRPLSEKIVEFTKEELADHRPEEIVAPPPVEFTTTCPHSLLDDIPAPAPTPYPGRPPHFYYRPREIVELVPKRLCAEDNDGTNGRDAGLHYLYTPGERAVQIWTEKETDRSSYGPSHFSTETRN